MPPLPTCSECGRRPVRSPRAIRCRQCADERRRAAKQRKSRRYYERRRAAKYADRACLSCGKPIPLDRDGNAVRCAPCAAERYRELNLGRKHAAASPSPSPHAASSGARGRRRPALEERECARCRQAVAMTPRQRLCPECSYRSCVRHTPEHRRKLHQQEASRRRRRQ